MKFMHEPNSFYGIDWMYNNQHSCFWLWNNNHEIPKQNAVSQLDDFIMFSKDNKVNLSSLLGYYSKVQFRNNSKDEAELFAVGADFVESSK